MLSLSSYTNNAPGCSDDSTQTGKKENNKNQVRAKQSKSTQEVEQSKQDEKYCEESINDSKKLAKIKIDVKQKSDSIHIITPNNGHYLAIVERINVNVNSTVSVRAKIENYPRGVLIMSTYENHTEGIIEIPEKNLKYHIKTDTDNGITYLMEFVEPDLILTDTVLVPPEKP